MATMKEVVAFNYRGKWSDTFHVANVSIGSGMYEEGLLAERSINEVEIKGNDKPLYKGIELQPLELELTIGFVKSLNDREIEQLIDWLFPTSYQPLYFKGKENRVFYCLPINQPSITHNGLGGGYIQITMRCNSPYVYSPTVLTKTYPVGSAPVSIEILNDGYGESYPEVSIQKIGSGHLTITNNSVNGHTLQVANLLNGENLYLDSEKELIETDAIGTYRYNDTVGFFPVLSEGRNVFTINGACTIQFRYRLKYRY